MIFEIQNTLVSSDIVEKKFVCDLTSCKGACCVEGDSGAPLEALEINLLDDLYEKIKPYMDGQGINAVEAQMPYLKGDDGEWETPLVDGKQCAYATFDKEGVASCSIEKAYNSGDITWKKPISCHLYPVRLKSYDRFIAVNYDQWDVCEPACKCGESLEVPIFRFLKEPLIKKFGADWYNELENFCQEWSKKNHNKI